MILRPFHPDDLALIRPQDAQAFEGAFVDMDLMYAAIPYSYTAEVDGVVIGCGGIVPLWADRGVAWTLLSGMSRGHFLAAHRLVVSALDVCPLRRVEAYVKKGFTQGQRWAEMLGFELEAETMRAFYPDGSDFMLYAKVR